MISLMFKIKTLKYILFNLNFFNLYNTSQFLLFNKFLTLKFHFIERIQLHFYILLYKYVCNNYY